MRIKEQELFEARANLKSKQYKQFVDGAEYVSKLFRIKLTPSNAVGMDMGQGVPIYEIDSRDLAMLSKYGRGEEVNGVEFRTFRENHDGSILIGVHDGSTLHTAMVADKSTIEEIISNVTWNDMDVQVMLADFLKSIGIRLGKDDVIYADPKGSKIQISRWGIIQLDKARTGKYGDAEILDIQVDQKYLTAKLEVLFDGFETIVDIDTKYRPNLSYRKITPYVEDILKVVGAKLENEPKNRHGSVSVLVPREVLNKLKSVRVFDFLNRDMFVVWNDKDSMIGFWENTQLTFITKEAEGSITFIDSTPDDINESTRSTQTLNESYNWNRKFTTIPKHML